MKNFTVLACLLSLSMPVFGSSNFVSETIEEAYEIPVTIGVKGAMASTKVKTSSVILCYPNEREEIIFSDRKYGTYDTLRFRMPSLPSSDLGKSFFVYYDSNYVQVEEDKRARFRTEIVLPMPKVGEKVEKIRLYARTFYSEELTEWTQEGYVEVIISNAQ